MARTGGLVYTDQTDLDHARQTWHAPPLLTGRNECVVTLLRKIPAGKPGGPLSFAPGGFRKIHGLLWPSRKTPITGVGHTAPCPTRGSLSQRYSSLIHCRDAHGPHMTSTAWGPETAALDQLFVPMRLDLRDSSDLLSNLPLRKAPGELYPRQSTAEQLGCNA